MFNFRVLGPLSVESDGGPMTPTAPKVAQTLALLLLRHDKVVSTATLAEELWETAPPRSAATTMQTYVYQLRKVVGDQTLETEGTGYVLHTLDGQVDLARFDQLTAEGREALGAGDLEGASRILGEALSLWDGDVLDNLEHGPVVQAHAAELNESRLCALEMRIQADFALERYRDLIGELRFLVARHPYHEWFHAQLIDALHRSGRRSEALQAFQDLRNVLAEDLGLEPSAALKELELAVLNA